ncbi:hypothetical protein Noda2021_06370 [Candidatus Dependentiae bacterium Noda2021]|nr:hypothetical protein Noda2021_06370 [Candidatus Dependentiae bacterium Noda2021]
MTRVSQSLSTFSQHEIARFFKSSRRVYKGPSFDILCLPQSKSHGRLIVVTPRKIGNAPARNKIRRQLKAIYFTNRFYELPVDCMIIIKKLPVSHESSEIISLLSSALHNFANTLSASHASQS